MDNITHTIIGLGVGALLHRGLPAEPEEGTQRSRHRLLLTGCAVASNLPDLDLLLTSALPAPLGYLLNHRGHTHTLLWALPQALALCALLWLCWPAARQLLRNSAAARLGGAAAVLLGLCLHLLMDYMNSYGLHPFAPFDGRWFYGDLVFIVEPFFWVAFGVPLAMGMRRRWPRYSWLCLLVVALLCFAVKALLAWTALAALLVMGALLAALQRRAGPRGQGALWLALLLSVSFLGVQAATAALGRERIAAVLRHSDPAARLLDVAMTAYPSQPLCWNFVTVESHEAAGTYRLRRGLLDLSAGGSCPAGLAGAEASAGSPDSTAAASHGVLLLAEESDNLRRLRQLQRDDCYVDAWLRFARAPSLRDDQLSDYRFATGGRGDFTVLQLERAQRRGCPLQVPAWTWPRQDLLSVPATPAAPAAPATPATPANTAAAPPA